MKTLDQVEARIIVNATNTPGDGTNSYIISAPGSYYLTGNIAGNEAGGIYLGAALRPHPRTGELSRAAAPTGK